MRHGCRKQEEGGPGQAAEPADADPMGLCGVAKKMCLLTKQAELLFKEEKWYHLTYT